MHIYGRGQQAGSDICQGVLGSVVRPCKHCYLRRAQLNNSTLDSPNNLCYPSANSHDSLRIPYHDQFH